MTRNAGVRRWSATGLGSFPGGDPITIVVGQAPGTDLIARAPAEPASDDDLGVPVTVENTPGADGALVAHAVAGAA